MVKQQNCIEKEQHVYNNCYELRSRAIKNEKITYVKTKLLNLKT